MLMLRERMLSMKEADRLSVIVQVFEKRLGQREAAERLGLSIRQVKRLVARYRERGCSGLVSGHRGKPSNNALAAAVQAEHERGGCRMRAGWPALGFGRYAPCAQGRERHSPKYPGTAHGFGTTKRGHFYFGLTKYFILLLNYAKLF